MGGEETGSALRTVKHQSGLFCVTLIEQSNNLGTVPLVAAPVWTHHVHACMYIMYHKFKANITPIYSI